MMLRKLLLPLMLGVLGTAPAVAAPREPVKPAAKSKKATVSTGTPSRTRGTKSVVKAAPKKKKRPAAPLPRGRRVASRAGKLVGASLAAHRVPDDCSGLVRAAYQAVGIELLSHGTLPGENAVSAIHRRAQRAGALHKRTPKPGDIVFFRETYDRNRDGVRNDGLTHVGVIETVERDGTVVFVHRGSNGVKRSRMNLRFPEQRGQGGRVLNDYIRRAEGGERARFASELFSGYASAARL
ncbi:NlpC/P60 family protein [Archangium lansingense]|uniref:NlpC/P60 family protein n=1 Tax=Archangium lansingense TaxID=2995310 RepID=A0ABT4AQY3_9BACT|nr:NlpC/P60 family protein [Archangium lansinium]MCY1083259.1 NlpC/P60 family protein [Archangium lansinium]